MPIETDAIPQLIKTSEERKLEQWKRDLFERLAINLQVHTKGQLFTKVDTLFPNEHPVSKQHTINTYEPITKPSIWKGINNLLRIFSNSSFSFAVGEDLNKWLADYQWKGQNLLTLFLDMWVNKSVAEDPNGLFVVYPPEYAEEHNMAPIQFVRSELIKTISKGMVSFVSEAESEVQYSMANTVTSREKFYDPTVNDLNVKTCTQTTYNQRLQIKVVKEVVHLFTVDGFIVYKNTAGNDYDYTLYNFPEPLSLIPVFAGGGVVVEKTDQLIYDSFVAPFVPFGNLSLLQHRNHRAVDLMFSYPRMSELETPCDNCVGGKIKAKKTATNQTGHTDCPSCKGSGFVTVQSPYKTYRRKYDPNDAGDNKHLQTPPVEFYSPDVGLINYSKDSWKDYLKLAEDSIFVQQKVYTGQVQSAESKGIDQEELYSWLNNISKVFYNNLRMVLQSLEDYMARSPVTVSVEKPYSFAVLTEGEAFIALNSILASEAPVFVKGNMVENFVNKFVSKDSPIVKALAVLKQYDSLLFYSTKDVQTFKASNTITAQMWTQHILGYPTLLKLYEQDKTIFEKSTDEIIKLLDAEIAKFNIPAPGADLRTTIAQQLQNEPTE